MAAVYTAFFFMGTTALFIVLWARARQDSEDWRRMSQVGFELAAEEMEREAAGREPRHPASRVNVAVRQRDRTLN